MISSILAWNILEERQIHCFDNNNKLKKFGTMLVDSSVVQFKESSLQYDDLVTMTW